MNKWRQVSLLFKLHNVTCPFVNWSNTGCNCAPWISPLKGVSNSDLSLLFCTAVIKVMALMYAHQITCLHTGWLSLVLFMWKEIKLPSLWSRSGKLSASSSINEEQRFERVLCHSNDRPYCFFLALAKLLARCMSPFTMGATPSAVDDTLDSEPVKQCRHSYFHFSAFLLIHCFTLPVLVAKVG